MGLRHCPSATLAVLSALAAVCTAPLAAAQEWPTRPVTMVVPFPASSASDTIGRIIGLRLSEVLGQQVIIENVGGAGGTTGVARVAKATPDGYQFVLGGVDTFAQSQALYRKPLYDAVSDFTPVILAGEQPLVLVARKDLAVSGLQDSLPMRRPIRLECNTVRRGSVRART